MATNIYGYWFKSPEQALGRCGRQRFQGAKGGGGGVCKLEAVPIEWAPVLGAQETSGGLAGGILAGTTEQKVEASGCRTD